MSLHQAVTVAGFSLRTNLRARGTRLGALGGLGILLLGPLLALWTGRGWSVDGGLGFYGTFIAALFVIRSGLEDQRASDLDTYLRLNLCSRPAYALGLALSLIAAWGLFCAGSFAALLLASAGDVGEAAWHTASWGLRFLLLLGFVPWVERFATLRLPLLLPALLYLGLLVALTLALGEERAMGLFLTVDRARPGTLLPLAAAAAGAFLLSAGPFVLAAGRWWGRRRWRARAPTAIIGA